MLVRLCEHRRPFEVPASNESALVPWFGIRLVALGPLLGGVHPLGRDDDVSLCQQRLKYFPFIGMDAVKCWYFVHSLRRDSSILLLSSGDAFL